MLALRLHGPRDVRIDEVEPPGEPGPGEVLVAPVLGGICGTDMQLYRGSRARNDVQILCHEFSAQVVATGQGVSSVHAGDRVAVVPIVACGQCETCGRGRGELCPGHASVGLRHPWGGFGELALVRATQLARLPDSVSWEQGALVEPLAVAMTGVERAGVVPGDRVLIVGGGPIGAFAMMAAIAAGASDVVVSEPHSGRAHRLRTLGADVIDPTEVDVAPYCRDRSGGAGFDAAIDCAGNAAALHTAIAAVRPAGRIAVTAVHAQRVDIDVRDLLSRSLTLAGAVAYPVWSWPRKLAQIATGRLQIERVITAVLPLAQGSSAFDRLLDPDGDDLKVLVRVRAD